MLETIKRHPLAIGGAIVGIGILFLVLRSGGSSATAAPTTDPSTVAAGVALQQTQMQLQAHVGDTAAALQATTAGYSAQLELAKLAAQTSVNNNTIASNVALAKINADSQTTSLVSTLTAQTQQAAINADVSKASIASNTTIQTTATLADIIRQQIGATAATQQAQIAKQCSGFFDCLF